MHEHTVKSGDTLSWIGQRFGVDWREIARVNDVETLTRSSRDGGSRSPRSVRIQEPAGSKAWAAADQVTALRR